MSRTSSLSTAAPVAAPPAAALSKPGLLATAGAFVIWGVFPIYLGALRHVSALQITAHRVAWSCILVLVWLAWRGELGKVREAIARPGLLRRLVLTAGLITINWLAFVWAVNAGRVTEVSLGYYINPLMNVLLGIVALNERLNRWQWLSVALAAAGVAYITFETGYVPWLAFAVAISFGLYGLIRKTASVEALPGLGIEMTLLMPIAAGYLIWCETQGIGALGHSTAAVNTLLICSATITALPLYLFAVGARLLPYSTVGVIQYLAPSLQLACAVFYFGEPFTHAEGIGFAFIWGALIVYAGDGLYRARHQFA